MNIQERLEEKLQEYKSLELAKNHLEKLEQRRQQIKNKLAALQSILEKEYQDIEQLEKLSLRALFEKLLGDKNQQLEKEKQEYLIAALNYNEQKKSLELLTFEKEVLQEKLKNFDRVKSEMHNLIRQREQSLIVEDSLAKQLLEDINTSLDKYILIHREYNQAIIIGLKIMHLLKIVIADLQTINAWGYHEQPESEKNFNHPYTLNSIRKNIYSINQLLQELQDELEDIYSTKDFSIQSTLNAFQFFVQSFFDNLISDWIILMKIQNALSTVQQVHHKVIRIVQSLKHELKNIEAETAYLRSKKERIIMNLN